MKGPKEVYVCTECDFQSPKWFGQCPSCSAWNTFVKETYQPAPAAKGAAAARPVSRAKVARPMISLGSVPAKMASFASPNRVLASQPRFSHHRLAA